jgi:succinoglycan biosynthesis transport protein ExoP
MPEALTRPGLPRGAVAEKPAEVRRRHFVTREATESYRKAALFVSHLVGEGSRAVMVCSARPGEGTTTAVLQLAEQLKNEYGLRPLVIELPRRKPMMVRLLRLDPEITLDRALSGGGTAADCVQCAASGLAVIAGGARKVSTRLPRLAERLQQVLFEVEELADVVLIDAPPVLQHADALIAGSIVPQVILVVESGRTDVGTLHRVKRELATEGVNIAGTMLVKHRRFIPRWVEWWLSR